MANTRFHVRTRPIDDMASEVLPAFPHLSEIKLTRPYVIVRGSNNRQRPKNSNTTHFCSHPLYGVVPTTINKTKKPARLLISLLPLSSQSPLRTARHGSIVVVAKCPECRHYECYVSSSHSSFSPLYTLKVRFHPSSTNPGTTSATQDQNPTTSNSNAGTTGSATQTGTGTPTNGKNTNSASPTSSISVNPVDPPGGVTMITPAASDASSTYFKIGATVTFSWNYTSVQVQPTAVNVQAYCPTNKYTSPFSCEEERC